MKRKSKRKLRNRRRFLMLIIIVLAVFILYKMKSKEDKPTIIDEELSVTYVNNITNSSNKAIKKEIENIIVDYLDLYTDSLVNLKSWNVTKLFTDRDSTEAYLTQTTIDTQVYHHSIQINDMHLKKAYYDMRFTDIKEKNNKITVTFKENDYYDFKYLKNITSRLIDIENTFVFNYMDGKYSIDSIRIDRDNYVIFTNVLEKGFTKKDIKKLNDDYIDKINKELESNKKLYSSAHKKEYVSKKICDHAYDRNKAVEYSYKYVEDRNDYYLDYSNLGGNCANFASQSIYEGGIPMDYDGSEQWKYFSDELNEEEAKRGRSSSWVSTYYFYKYAKYNDGSGMCAEVDLNIYYAEIGDIIHVGYKDNNFSHTTIVSKVIKENGKVEDILINSNTTGLKDYPIFGYIYQIKD